MPACMSDFGTDMSGLSFGGFTFSQQQGGDLFGNGAGVSGGGGGAEFGFGGNGDGMQTDDVMMDVSMGVPESMGMGMDYEDGMVVDDSCFDVESLAGSDAMSIFSNYGPDSTFSNRYSADEVSLMGNNFFDPSSFISYSENGGGPDMGYDGQSLSVQSAYGEGLSPSSARSSFCEESSSSSAGVSGGGSDGMAPSDLMGMADGDEAILGAALASRARRKGTRTTAPSIASVDSMPTTASSSPAPPADAKKRLRRIVAEEEACCRGCREILGTLLLHGTPEAVAMPHVVDMLCLRCEEWLGQKGPPIKGRRKRGLGDGPEAVVECEACRKKIGSGGVRAGSPSSPAPLAETLIKRESGVGSDDRSSGPSPNSGTPTPGDGGAWVLPDFGVEILCIACRDKYAFCTECGSGGKFRTGKWRPVQLFEAGRRTCSLSHLRVGDAELKIGLWRTPGEMMSAPPEQVEKLLAEIQEMYWDSGMTNVAVPKVMENVPSISTWSQLESRAHAAWEEVRSLATRPEPPG
ncbi:hypothetical protein HK104_003673, partial [Borealophlyctis nickersoniae]